MVLLGFSVVLIMITVSFWTGCRDWEDGHHVATDFFLFPWLVAVSEDGTSRGRGQVHKPSVAQPMILSLLLFNMQKTSPEIEKVALHPKSSCVDRLVEAMAGRGGMGASTFGRSDVELQI